MGSRELKAHCQLQTETLELLKMAMKTTTPLNLLHPSGAARLRAETTVTVKWIAQPPGDGDGQLCE